MERDVPCALRIWRNRRISTHTLTWSVTIVGIYALPYYFNFNSHAHVERDSRNCKRVGVNGYFNSHAHVERDRTYLSSHEAPRSFQLTRSRGAWLVGGSAGAGAVNNFNSHAHVERDHECINPDWQIFISTHTLTWSVTSFVNDVFHVLKFQLTRSRGAWRC